MSSPVILIFCLRTKPPSLDHSSSHLIPPCPTQLNLSKELSIHNPHFVTCHSFSVHVNLASATTGQRNLLSHLGDAAHPFFSSPLGVIPHRWALPESKTLLLFSCHLTFLVFPCFSDLLLLFFQVYLSPGSDICLQTCYLHVDFSKKKIRLCFSNFNRHMNLLGILIKAVSDTVGVNGPKRLRFWNTPRWCWWSIGHNE